jgi:hypothetical protein
MRLLLPLLLLLTACPTDDPVDPDDPVGTPPPLGDALVYGARSANTSTFFESTDVEVWGDTAYVCTGVQSLSLHDISDMDAPAAAGRVTFSGSHGSYPRCSHVNGTADRAFVVSHQDEVQRTPWIAILDVSSPASPVLLDEFSTETTLEEPVFLDGTLYVAAHNDGIAAFDVSADTLPDPEITSGFGNVNRVGTLGGSLVAGTLTGDVLYFDGDLNVTTEVDLGAPITALLEVDGNLLVALGATGLVLLSPSGAELDRVDTHGIALRLDTLGDGNVLVTNWHDLRVYSATDSLTLLAVDAVYQADDRPRHLAAGSDGLRVVSGEWAGVHTLHYLPGVGGPEISVSDLLIKIPADGQPHDVDITLLNEGNWPLEITDFDFEEGWSTDDINVVLDPGESYVAVLHHEGSDINLAESLFIESTDIDEPRIEVDLRVGSPAVTVGDPAPTFTYTGLNTGEVHDLESQEGKVVVLSYFGVF